MLQISSTSKQLWWKANDDHIARYKIILDEELAKINMPIEALYCDDVKCSVHSNNLQVFHDDIILCCLRASNYIPVSKKRDSKCGIPGWNEYIKHHRDTAMFWHRLWKDNGSPNAGVIFNIRRKTRYQYHNALKQVKRHQNDIKAANMAHNLNTSGRNDFWFELRKSLGNGGTLPCTVDGESGVDKIAELFHKKYDNLYNSVPYNTQDMVKPASDIDNVCITDSSVRVTVPDL